METKGSCTKIREWLVEYAGRPLTGTKAEQIQDHLSRCPDCRGLHEENTRIVEALRGDFRPVPGPDFWKRMTSEIMAEVRHLESRPRPWYRRSWFTPWGWPVYAWSPALALLVLTAGLYYYSSFSKPVFLAKIGISAAESQLEDSGDSLEDPFMTLSSQESARLRKTMGRRLARELYARNGDLEEAVLDWDLFNRMETLSLEDLNKVADKLQTGAPAGSKEVTGNVS
jgi:Putative zinc-finger